MMFIIHCSIFMGIIDNCVVGFLKPQRTQRRNSFKQDLCVFFSVFLVVNVFETTEDHKGGVA